MPHLVILYSGNLDAHADMPALCRDLAATLVAQRDDEGKPVFPVGGTRVLAYPATHWAIADGGAAGLGANGDGEYGFAYMNLRMARGRSAAVQQRVGQALSAVVKQRLERLLQTKHVGITLQIDEGAEVFDAKHSSLHPLFNRPKA